MNDKPVKQLTKYDVQKCISKGMKYEDMMKAKNRIASNDELTIENKTR